MSLFYPLAAATFGIIAFFVLDGVRTAWRRDGAGVRANGVALGLAYFGWALYFGRGGEPAWLPLASWALMLPAIWARLRDTSWRKQVDDRDPPERNRGAPVRGGGASSH